MRTAEDQLKHEGTGVLSLEVAENNPAARQFYRSLGFVVRGRIAKYYGGKVDAEVMEKVIGYCLAREGTLLLISWPEPSPHLSPVSGL